MEDWGDFPSPGDSGRRRGRRARPAVGNPDDAWADSGAYAHGSDPYADKGSDPYWAPQDDPPPQGRRYRAVQSPEDYGRGFADDYRSDGGAYSSGPSYAPSPESGYGGPGAYAPPPWSDGFSEPQGRRSPAGDPSESVDWPADSVPQRNASRPGGYSRSSMPPEASVSWQAPSSAYAPGRPAGGARPEPAAPLFPPSPDPDMSSAPAAAPYPPSPQLDRFDPSVAYAPGPAPLDPGYAPNRNAPDPSGRAREVRRPAEHDALPRRERASRPPSGRGSHAATKGETRAVRGAARSGSPATTLAGGDTATLSVTNSLQLRIVLATAGVVAVLASLLSFDQALALSKESRTAVQNELVAVAETFSIDLEATGTIEPEEVEKLAARLAERHELSSVRVYEIDSAGKAPVVKLLAGADEERAALPADSPDAQTMVSGISAYRQVECETQEEETGKCGRAVAASPTPPDQAVLGVLIERDLTTAREEIARRERRAAVGVFALTGLVGAFLAWMLRHWIFFPLRRLQLALRAMESGRPERRLHWQSDDELGALANEIDALGDKVQHSDESLADLALEDRLTGLPNRRAGLSQLAGEVAAGQREEKPVAVAVFEVDELDRIGKRYGQEIVAETLRKFGDAVRLSLRPSDVCAHLGDDRFLLILRGSDARSAHAALDRLREVMTRLRVGPSGGMHLTAGVVESWAASAPDELVRRAEEELEISRRRLSRSY